MKIVSPFEGLQLPESLACEFFAVFSRFEFTLKESGFIRKDQQRVEPAWWSFAERVSGYLCIKPNSELWEAVQYLTSEIPQVQISQDEWSPIPLHGKTQIENSIDAVIRVRNNLFHGGKHTPHSPPGRDEKLVCSSLAVLYACLEQNDKLRQIYEQNVF